MKSTKELIADLELDGKLTKLLAPYADLDLSQSLNCIAVLKELFNFDRSFFPLNSEKMNAVIKHLFDEWHVYNLDASNSEDRNKYVIGDSITYSDQYYTEMANNKIHVQRNIVEDNNLDRYINALVFNDKQCSIYPEWNLKDEDRKNLSHIRLKRLTLKFKAFKDGYRDSEHDVDLDYENTDQNHKIIREKIKELCETDYQYCLLFPSNPMEIDNDLGQLAKVKELNSRKASTYIWRAHDLYGFLACKADMSDRSLMLKDVETTDMPENIDDKIKISNRTLLNVELDPKYAAQAKALMVLTIMYEIQSKRLSNAMATALSTLIYRQQQEFDLLIDNGNGAKHKNSNDLESVYESFSAGVKKFLINFRIPNSKSGVSKITYLDMAKYMNDVINHKPVSPKMLRAISGNGQADDFIYEQIKRQNIGQILKPVKITTQEAICQQLESGVRKHVKAIYQITKSNDVSNYRHHKTLVHGTKNMSVLDILANGLLDQYHLRSKTKFHYETTGLGLGNGIYFSRPDQCGKSANYTSYGDRNIHTYMFICDVGYDHKTDVKHYTDALVGDLVWAHGVGSHSRDELLARNPKQVQLRYLVELEK